MQVRFFLLSILIMSILFVSSIPCLAWLYDGGIPQHLGAMMNYDSVLDAAPLTVESDSYATVFGVALARAYGTAGGSFKVALTIASQGLPGSTIAEWTIVPTDGTLQYYYVSPVNPILLRANTSYALVFNINTDGFHGTIGCSPQGYYGWTSPDSGKTWGRMLYPLSVRVDGAVVPEPTSVTALIFALMGTGALRKRRS